MSGWASVPSTSSAVRVSIDGRVITDAHASGFRANVDRAYRIAGNHGFIVRLGAIAGRHTVCAIALPASGNSYARSLGCRVVTVTG